MLSIWLAFLVVTFLLAFKRTSYGCCCLLVSRILIPECVRLIPIVDMSLNTCVIAILLLATARDLFLGNIRLLNDKYVKTLVVFMAVFFITLPLADTLDYQTQSGSWFRFLFTDICPAIIFIVALRKKKDVVIVLKTLFVVCVINCVYGCLTIAIGANPYSFAINSLYSTRQAQMEAFNDMVSTRGGILITSSTFEHENGWGYFLPITFVLFFYLYKRNDGIFKESTLLLLLILLSVGVIICGKRSAYVSYMAFWMVFLIIFRYIRWRYFLFALLGIFLFVIICEIFPQLEKVRNLIESSLFFWDDAIREKNNVGGSSWELRVNQILYPWVEIKDNILFGHGMGWTGVYLQKTGEIHPILYGFESIFSTAVCDGGLVGSIMWIWLFFKSYKYSIQHRQWKVWAKLLTFVQVVIAIATGLSYFVFYGMYIVILNKLYLLDENINSNGNIQLLKHNRGNIV